MSSSRRRSAAASAQAREFSAGGVVVRGEQVVVIVPTRRAADGSRVLALPKGHVDPGETPVAGGRARGARGDRDRRRAGRASSGETRYWYRRDGRTIGKACRSSCSATSAATPPTTTTRSKRCAGSASSEAADGAQPRGRARDGERCALGLPGRAKTDSLPLRCRSSTSTRRSSPTSSSGVARRPRSGSATSRASTARTRLCWSRSATSTRRANGSSKRSSTRSR